MKLKIVQLELFQKDKLFRKYNYARENRTSKNEDSSHIFRSFTEENVIVPEGEMRVYIRSLRESEDNLLS
jgi:hypothetical protein